MPETSADHGIVAMPSGAAEPPGGVNGPPGGRWCSSLQAVESDRVMRARIDHKPSLDRVASGHSQAAALECSLTIVPRFARVSRRRVRLAMELAFHCAGDRRRQRVAG